MLCSAAARLVASAARARCSGRSAAASAAAATAAAAGSLLAGSTADCEGGGGGEYTFNGFTPRQPKVPYPGWDVDWDGRKPKPRAEGEPKPVTGPSRHLILIRHGQYDETYRDDAKRILTPLGREQAEATGKRLAELIAAGVSITRMHVSDLARAKETADIIAKHLPETERTPPNPDLNEASPHPSGRRPATRWLSQRWGCCAGASGARLPRRPPRYVPRPTALKHPSRYIRHSSAS